jgi:hypothetical protein
MMYTAEHEALINIAVVRFQADLAAKLPFTGNTIWQWVISQHPPEIWTHPRGFPFFLIPWWAEGEINGAVDTAFQTDLIYASIVAYCQIRMIDNVMDGHASQEHQLIGATGIFHLLFQAVYQQYFPADHPFWAFFQQCYLEAADVTMQDGLYTDKTEAQFVEVISRKTAFANIPLAAVCYRYNRPDKIAAWSDFIVRFSRWHLMEEDVFDYLVDISTQTPTFFLCEAARRKQPDERVEAWAIREGLRWAFGLMAAWMIEIKASKLSAEALAYVEAREALQVKQYQKFSSALDTLAKLLAR